MKLSEMRDLLGSRGIQLTKSLGQNFLHDANQLARIVSLAQLQPGDKVLEIGPGLGPLTEQILAAGASVLAIEKDNRLCEVLRERFGGNPSFGLLHEDALDYLKQNKRSWADWTLVSNLPYSVGSPILVELATAAAPPRRLVATLQLEVVQRIKAAAGTENYGQLSLFLQLRYVPVDDFKIPAGSFFPPPDVDSACIALARRDSELLPQSLAPLFMQIVKKAFSERRKVMMKLLKREFSATALEGAFQELGIDPQARAETVSLKQFAGLALALSK